MPVKDADTPVHLQHVLIKWTGGKRRQARRTVGRFPRKIATYHEPFLGGGAVLHELLGRTDIPGRSHRVRRHLRPAHRTLANRP